MLTANRNTRERDPRIRKYPVQDGAIIYAGGMAALNRKTGYLQMAEPDAELVVIGRAEEYVDNRGGNLYAAVKTGCFLFQNSVERPVTLACVGETCLVEDDATVKKGLGPADADGILSALI